MQKRSFFDENGAKLSFTFTWKKTSKLEQIHLTPQPMYNCILANWGHVFQVIGLVDTTLGFFSLFCFVHLFCDHF